MNVDAEVDVRAAVVMAINRNVGRRNGPVSRTSRLLGSAGVSCRRGWGTIRESIVV